MPKRPAPNFGTVFRRDIDWAKSGYTAPGGSSDGSSALGTDYDQEFRYDIKASDYPGFRVRSRNEAEADRKKRTHYPTTRLGRATNGINSILNEFGRVKGIRKPETDVSGW